MNLALSSKGSHQRMAEDAKLYRERAEAERRLAAISGLPNVRDRALRSAEKWDELAIRVERGQAGAVMRNGGSIDP